MKALLACLFSVVAPLHVAVASATHLESFLEDDGVRDIRISPTGEYYAMAVKSEGQTGLMVMGRDDRRVVSVMRFGRDTHVAGFWWVNDERILMSLAETFGTRDDPVPTGELFGMNADGGRKELLVGYRVQGPQFGTRVGTGVRKKGDVAAFLVDPLPDDDRHVLVSVRPFGNDPFSRVEKLDVYDGRRVRVASAPVERADFVTDSRGQVRFAMGSLPDNYSQLFHRDDDGSEWRQVNHERQSGRVERPLGFSADDSVAYLQVSQPDGPDRIVAFDARSDERSELPGDAVVDPVPVYRDGWKHPVGAWYFTGEPYAAFFDEESDEARLHRMLQSAFPGHRVSIRSSSRDGRLRVVLVESDVDPGTFYLFDTRARNADLILVRDKQIVAEQMSPMTPIELEARDGTTLHGFVTIPAGSTGQSLPMVVMPHGGPFGVFDIRGFDRDVQLLAAHGYAVLQVNFRGSGNYGRAFKLAGARQWGAAMQDDVTDATQWAIGQGIADPDRVCIFGASYGAYAALMGVAREPGLYRCAAGYVGVYDLNRLRRDDAARGRSSATWAREWIGDDTALLEAASPDRRAAEIRVPVFLAAGGEDFIAPIEHTKRMEAALRRAGVPVETLYYTKEGHGFYDAGHRSEFYRRLLAFLSRNIGGVDAR